ncbi:MAG: M24 family metallopeptidase, partial [Candidatus Hadarchaeales archaeon]
MLTPEELEKYRKVGKILAEVREEIRKMVKPGVRIFDLAETAEELIRKKGAKPAFPCNISVNEIAAHYSPPVDDQRVIQ